MSASTSVHSNAFNFMSFLQNGVDPRTGQYTVAINLPELKANDLQGPAFKLALTYNPLNTQDSGFGLGWNLQLSQYTPHNQVLSLSTGESFKVTGSRVTERGTELLMKEKKLDSFHVYRLDDNEGPGSRFRVVHRSGQVEVLEVMGAADNRVALPVQVFGATGHSLSLSYQPFDNRFNRLASISDDSGELLSIERDNIMVKVHFNPGQGEGGEALARFDMLLEGSERRVARIDLPTHDKASWRFKYEKVRDHFCLVEVQTPTGASENLYYTDDGHAFPVGSGRTALPRVTQHLTRPNFDQPVVDVRYTYPDAKNFLGHTLAIQWADDGLDNLYKYVGEYRYGSVESLWVTENVQGAETLREVRSIARSFNQFHLLVEEKTTQGNCVQTQATEYYLTSGAAFEQQVSYCQLPKKTDTRWSLLDDASQTRVETTSNTYDTQGNLLTRTHPTGVEETSTWYPAAGGEGCPKDPEGFVRHLKDTTTTPAPTGKGAAPTLRQRYRYITLPALSGSGLEAAHVVESETLLEVSSAAQVRLAGLMAMVGERLAGLLAPFVDSLGQALRIDAEDELQRTSHDYTNAPGDAFAHGRVVTTRVTLNGLLTQTAFTYRKGPSRRAGEHVLTTTQVLTGFDGEAKTITLEHSLLTGEPLLNRDDNDVEIAYVYDVLRRVIRETVAPGTEFEASRRYEYALCSADGDQAEQRRFDVKDVMTCSRFDGLNRVIHEERDDVDSDDQVLAGTPRPIYKARYDALGNLVEETEIDWLGAVDLVLTTAFEQDDWGQLDCTITPDGVSTYARVNPLGTPTHRGPVQRSWREAPAAKDGSPQAQSTTGVTETWIDLFGKPVRVERFDLDGKAISLQVNEYDGLGRTSKETVSFGTLNRVNSYVYDAFDRLLAHTLPSNPNHIVYRSFAPHSSEDLPISIKVGTKLLGEQSFDGLDRLATATTGGRLQRYSYAPGMRQPRSVTAPNGEVITYEYQATLGEEPLKRVLGNSPATYNYDAKNANLLNCSVDDQALARTYFSTGQVKTETRTQDGVDYHMAYAYSRTGRLLSYTDVLGQDQVNEYDECGRLKRTTLGSLSSDFTYDGFGRTASYTTRDGDQSLKTSLEYDEFEREILRTFDLGGTQQTLAQVYNDVDGLTLKTLREGTKLLREEAYFYDTGDRLVRYACTGEQCPVDPYGKTIVDQVFRMDELDNITLVVTNFGTGRNNATYKFENAADPAQLTSITNNHADYPALIELTYDTNGNLTRDEAGRTLRYDALNRLLDVEDLEGGFSHYAYDPKDTLTGQSSGTTRAQAQLS
ncbi:YD repeat-containing protein [Pseudomonas reidholzensis]|uniref:YD repeat-containing protein n=1 Tax=Pseudomonas reidholzensis TaxID=1785162 RepID=A0A383S015_9PSED|nr:RHS repeat protein [Pseudomonas reidholzensis]SYX92041.1 YD repeat-containing protein [Pseudomonas reidholzensis]